MKRHTRIVLLLAAAILWLCQLPLHRPSTLSAGSLRQDTTVSICQPADTALPVQLAKNQVQPAGTTAREQHRQTQESVFGLPARQHFSQQLAGRIVLSQRLLAGLPKYDIAFPFDAFW